MPSLVLDASAILAALQEEPGGEAVFDLLVPSVRETVFVSAVNLCEVTSKLVMDGGKPRNVTAAIAPFRNLVIPFDLLQAEKAAWLGRETRAIGLSLGDRACLALASARGATVWTADRVWKRLEIEVPVHLIRG